MMRRFSKSRFYRRRYALITWEPLALCRNIVPKPVQQSVPIEVSGVSRRETIHLAARNGLGALTLESEQAANRVEEYCPNVKSPDCVPPAYTSIATSRS